MGNQPSASTSYRGLPLGASGETTTNNDPSSWPLHFHTCHSENIKISQNKQVSKRVESFCKGICFTDRPIAINEKVVVKFKETSTSWSGVLRLGFTSVDPSTLRSADLPRYACPDLTNKPGNYGKALGERNAERGNILAFYLTRLGEVHYSLNGEDKGVFLCMVNVTAPLWAMFDVYGNTVAIELVNPDTIPVVNSTVLAPVLPSSLPSVVPLPFDMSTQTLTRYHLNINFTPMPFHTLCGKNVKLSSDRTIGIRSPEDFCNGYVFTERPLACGEKIVLQILGLDATFDGGLGFGLTSCDPTMISQESLPDDSDLLLDRMEYWVVNKDVCRIAEIGDELSFTLSIEGEVKYSRNNHRVGTLMHVDRTLPLWAFFDIYGSIQKIKILGVVPALSHRLPQRAHSTSSFPDNPGITVALPPQQNAGITTASGAPHIRPPVLLRSSSVPSTSVKPPVPPKPLLHPFIPSPIDETEERNPISDNNENECSVCYEKAVNSVLYTCGHMCMCYECAVLVQTQKSNLCPICRQTIKDVIKIYRT